MARKLQLAIFGSDGDHCSKELYESAHALGRLLPKDDVLLLTGGGSGVMEAVSKGFSEIGGFVVGVLPGQVISEANSYCSLVLPTGMGFARGQILANSADAAVVLGGGCGTRNEVNECYWRRFPVMALASSGGTATEVAGRFMDGRRLVEVASANSLQEVVSWLDLMIKE